ncbi:hypothetical protein FPV67DRAFT_1456066 [Lyophyllum atratum]|nr:hypothetical protein FPV67DRAFT_1456066 [Lyophyllum atratum]
MNTCDDEFPWSWSPLGHGLQDYYNYDSPTPGLLQKADALITPPHTFTETTQPSHSPTPNPDLSVSTAFYPGSHALGFNLIFSSSDGVLFYVHTDVILQKSKDAFYTLLAPFASLRNASKPSIIPVPESSMILELILYIIYSITCTKRGPALPTVFTAIDHMPHYSVSPKDYITPSHPIYEYILSFAPFSPLEVYALAGHHDLLELATATSSHLLSYPLATIDDRAAARIGAVYLRRLFILHESRLHALRSILLAPPQLHPPTRKCDVADQKNLARAWALVTAHLAWEARPDLSSPSIQNAFRGLGDQLRCRMCREMLADRLRDVATRWVGVKGYNLLGVHCGPLGISLAG